jgi:hypothetical protein
MALLANLAAADFDTSPRQLLERTAKPSARWKNSNATGHLYNWYDTRLRQIAARFLCVECRYGNLVGALATLRASVGIEKPAHFLATFGGLGTPWEWYRRRQPAAPRNCKTAAPSPAR